MTSPEPSSQSSGDERPRMVDVAFWLWVLAAGLLFLSGLSGVTARFSAVRMASKSEFSDEQVGNIVTALRAWGALCLVLALVIAYLAGRTRGGDPRFRRALIALSVVSVLGTLPMTGLGIAGILPLLAALALIAASVLVIRPSAQTWFDRVGGAGGG